METYDSRYRCTRCGACCRWSGYVWLTDEEVGQLAGSLGLSVDEFTDRYTRLTDDRRGLSLVERADESCVFLTDTNHCQVYPVRPQQCRDFPNGWRFPGFDRDCRAEDTWQGREPAEREHD